MPHASWLKDPRRQDRQRRLPARHLIQAFGSMWNSRSDEMKLDALLAFC